MKVLTKPLEQEQKSANHFEVFSDTQTAEELSIRLKSSHDHPSPMPAQLKNDVRKNASSLYELLDSTIKSKGESLSKKEWVEGHTLEVEGLSQMTLHSFILQAEKLGKRIQYTKTLTVKITD
ncbi:MAG: hypothetical protein ABJH72_22085 [Reichenbachiella sp.]|uniref:hypothetical protein n=1 Tax=Reichenbachiella sp. TaxID=2184521 RepID=UPI003266F690